MVSLRDNGKKHVQAADYHCHCEGTACFAMTHFFGSEVRKRIKLSIPSPAELWK